MPKSTAPVLISSHAGDRFAVSKLSYPIGFTLPKHHHEDACFQVMLDGAFCESGWRDRDGFKRGEVLFRPAGFEHANKPADVPATALSIRLDLARISEDVVNHIARARPAVLKNPHVALLAARINREIKTHDDFSEAVIDSLCVELVVEALRADPRDSHAAEQARLVAKAVKLVEHGIGGPMTVESIAEELGVDRFRLNRAFLNYQRCSPAEFIRAKRLETAQRLLARTDRPIALIAGECGFSDQSHLTRSFKAVMGVTPAQFRLLKNDH